MKTKKKTKKGRPPLTRQDRMWAALREAIYYYADCRVAESWKGGGDPASIPAVDAELALALAKLNEQIVVVRREYE